MRRVNGISIVRDIVIPDSVRVAERAVDIPKIKHLSL